MLTSTPDMHAGFTNTLNGTIIDAGIKSNVIPARSEAFIDCRLLPGQSREQWRDAIAAQLDGLDVEVQQLVDRDRPPPAVSEWDTELSRTIEAVLKDSMEDAVVAPGLSTVGTDNRFLRSLGITSYGLIPCLLSAEERAGFHANNEFLTIDNLNMGVELMYETVRRFCT